MTADGPDANGTGAPNGNGIGASGRDVRAEAEDVEVGLLVALQSSLASSGMPPVDVSLDGSYPLTEIVLAAHGRLERHSIWLFDPAEPDTPATLDVQFALYRLATTAAWLADSPDAETETEG